MKEILETIILSLVDNANDVIITEKTDEKSITYTVKLNSTDMGRVIGKQGRVAKSIRTIVKTLSGKDERRRISVDFTD